MHKINISAIFRSQNSRDYTVIIPGLENSPGSHDLGLRHCPTLTHTAT